MIYCTIYPAKSNFGFFPALRIKIYMRVCSGLFSARSLLAIEPESRAQGHSLLILSSPVRNYRVFSLGINDMSLIPPCCGSISNH